MVSRSRARTSPHHRPHGLTRKPSPCCHVMWPVMFSHHPTSSRWRNAIASSCAGVRSIPGPGTARGAHAASPPVRASDMCTPSTTTVDGRSVPAEPVVGHRGFRPGSAGYDGHVGILVLVLVVLAIIALVLYIARRSRV